MAEFKESCQRKEASSGRIRSNGHTARFRKGFVRVSIEHEKNKSNERMKVDSRVYWRVRAKSWLMTFAGDLILSRKTTTILIVLTFRLEHKLWPVEHSNNPVNIDGLKISIPYFSITILSLVFK